MPSGLHYLNFVFADDELVATEDDKHAENISEGADTDYASDSNCSDGACAPLKLTSAAALAAVDTLRMYFGTFKLGESFGSQLDGMVAVILKSAIARTTRSPQ